MPQDVTILTARRALEFTPDALRLTLAVSAPVQQALRDRFQFQQVAVGQPMATFGAIPPTLPPGVVFDNGSLSLDAGRILAVRFLHFEPLRLVIDVAGTSEEADAALKIVADVLEPFQSADGSPIIGAPTRNMDYSQIAATLAFRIDEILRPGLSEILNSAIRSSYAHDFTAALVMNVFGNPGDGPFTGVAEAESRVLQLAPRAGFPLDARRYFSAAPLRSKDHVAYLAAMEQAVGTMDREAK